MDSEPDYVIEGWSKFGTCLADNAKEMAKFLAHKPAEKSMNLVGYLSLPESIKKHYQPLPSNYFQEHAIIDHPAQVSLENLTKLAFKPSKDLN